MRRIHVVLASNSNSYMGKLLIFYTLYTILRMPFVVQNWSQLDLAYDLTLQLEIWIRLSHISSKNRCTKTRPISLLAKFEMKNLLGPVFAGLIRYLWRFTQKAGLRRCRDALSTTHGLYLEHNKSTRTDLGHVNKERNQFETADADARCEYSTAWTFLPLTLTLGVNELLASEQWVHYNTNHHLGTKSATISQNPRT